MEADPARPSELTPSTPISRYSQIGAICGGASTAVQAAIHDQQVSMMLLAALVGGLTGLVVGALYGYLKLRLGSR